MIFEKSKNNKIFNILQNKYGNVKPFLNHKNEFEFLIAIILSAQTTDKMVNEVTPKLFHNYPTALMMKNADFDSLKNLIYKVNFHNNKTKFLIETSKIIDEIYNNNIPKQIDLLTKFPGVGRKVANVFIAEYGQEQQGIVVDTHIKRVSKRIGWTTKTDPNQIEKDLIKIFPLSAYKDTPKQLILIGREYCLPHIPNCRDCPISQYCQKNL